MFTKNRRLNVYLGDITYDTIIIVSDTIPINIGFIGSYMKKKFGKKIDLTLFKYPNEIIKAIKTNPPDMLGLSNYSWNSNLSEYISSIAKKCNPNVITVQGGTNFPYDENSQIKFLSERPTTDIYTYLESEKSCSNIVQRIFDSGKDRNLFFDKPIDGCMFIYPETKKSNQKIFVKGKTLERIKNLDEVPSPYLTGILDKFFDGKLTPFLETNRGCPFTCSFCHTANHYFHKLNKFSEDRIRDEIEYIGKKAGKLRITNLHLADVNFGMYPSDRKICEFLVESKKKHGWPLQIMGTTGKNNKKRVLEITNMLGDMFSVNMATQTMDEQVLKNIARSNIKLSDMIEVNEHLRKKGRATHAEFIVPLPGETKKTFIEGLNKILNSDVSDVCIYTLMMLKGTKFQDTNYRKKFEYKSKFRIVPLDFGEYEGQKIFDYEEVGVETKHLSFNDYLYIRTLSLFVESIYNGRPFDEFFKYAKQFQIYPATMIKILRDNISNASENIQKIMNDFVAETKNELWNSEEELLNYYKKEENYLKLKKGKVGGNLIYKYKSKNLVSAVLDWVNYFEEQLFKAIKEKHINISSIENIKLEISEIASFCKLKLDALLNAKVDTKTKFGQFQFDVLKWIDHNSRSEKKFSECKFLHNKGKLYFEFTTEQIKNRNDLFTRYGTDTNGLSKIVTRISSLQSQFRKVRYEDKKYLRDIYKKEEKHFVKYALSN